MVWDLEGPWNEHSLGAHAERVTAVGPMRDGQLAISGSDDKVVKVWDLDREDGLAACSCDGPVSRCAAAPDSRSLVAGDCYGGMHFLYLENISAGPSVVTSWRASGARGRAFGCLHCRTCSEIPESALGTELPCPHCRVAFRLNPFVIEADWRPVATAWHREAKE